MEIEEGRLLRGRGASESPVTVLIGADQRAAIDDLRRRCPDRTEVAFWSIVLGDGIALFDFQLHEEEVATGTRHAASDVGAQGSSISGVAAESAIDDTVAVAIPIDDATLIVLRALRDRRPEWTDALFWREVLDWGIVLLGQRLDDEDDDRAGIVREAPPLRSYEPGLGWIPF